MDPKEQDTNQLFEQLKDSLKNIPRSSITPQTIDQLTSIDLSSLNYNNTVVNGGATISVNPSVYTISGAGMNPGPYYTAGTGINNTSPWATTSSSGSTKIHLEGEDADIEINGKSLARTIQSLEERLNILVPNPELEKEWDELKELGNKYRTLEAKLKEQSKMRQKLKEMPPPTPLY
jgi:hypothetical protein